MMQHVSGDGAVEEMFVDYAELAVHCRGGTTEE